MIYSQVVGFKLKDGENINLRFDRQYLVEVRGFIGNKDLPAGSYRMRLVRQSDAPKTVWALLYKPKGRKEVARMYANQMQFMRKEYRDINGTVLMATYEGSL